MHACLPRLFFLCLCWFTLPAGSNAQLTQQGFIISTTGGRIEGYIARDPFAQYFSRVRFSTSQEGPFATYTPAQILAFQVGDDAYFMRKVLPVPSNELNAGTTVFMEVLLVGAISLFQHHEDVFIEEAGSLRLLPLTPVREQQGRTMTITPAKELLAFIQQLKASCPDVGGEIPSNYTQYDAQVLRKILLAYHQCRGLQVTDYARPSQVVRLEKGLWARGGGNSWEGNTYYYTGEFPVAALNQQGWNWELGGSVHLFSPRYYRMPGLVLEAAYHQQRYHVDEKIPNRYITRYLEAFSTVAFLQLRALLRYPLLRGEGGVGVFPEIGIQLATPLASRERVVVDTEFNSNQWTTSFYEESFAPLAGSFFGYTLGLRATLPTGPSWRRGWSVGASYVQTSNAPNGALQSSPTSFRFRQWQLSLQKTF